MPGHPKHNLGTTMALLRLPRDSSEETLARVAAAHWVMHPV